MFIKLGTKLYNHAKRAYPILADGTAIIPPQIKFSLKNPYILETIPDKKLEELKLFEGKKLKTVCRILDNDNYTQILNRYKKLCSQSKGFSEAELQILYKKAFPNIKVPTDINYDAFIRDDFDTYFIDRAKAIMSVIESVMGKAISDKGSEQTIKEYGVSLEELL